jgi:hypothetical protein
LLVVEGDFLRELPPSYFVKSVGREAMVCEEPLLTVDRQMGLNIVHPDGKVGLDFLAWES